MLNQDLVVSQSININAAASKVWDVLTNPKIIKEYLFGTETITDWQPGSPVTFHGVYGENGEHSYRDGGTVVENIVNEKLSYTYWSGFSGLEETPENHSLITYTLKSESPGITNFTWTQRGYASEEGYQHSLTGMTAFLEQIKEIAEK